MEPFEEVWTFLERDDVLLCYTSEGKPFQVPFELKSEDFIAFAKEDVN